MVSEVFRPFEGIRLRPSPLRKCGLRVGGRPCGKPGVQGLPDGICEDHARAVVEAVRVLSAQPPLDGPVAEEPPTG